MLGFDGGLVVRVFAIALASQSWSMLVVASFNFASLIIDSTALISSLFLEAFPQLIQISIPNFGDPCMHSLLMIVTVPSRDREVLIFLLDQRIDGLLRMFDV